MSKPTDVELTRTVNALSTTLRDQRPDRLSEERLQAICDGALGGESKLAVHADSGGSAQVTARDGGLLVIRVQRDADNWMVERVRHGQGSDWAEPS